MTTATMRILLGMAVLVLFAEAARPVGAQVITNGSFEQGVDPGQNYVTLFSGDSTSLKGWTVIGRNIDYINHLWKGSKGSKSLDLSGSGPGGIEQILKTLPGESIRIQFDLAGNPGNGGGIRRLEVNAAGKTRDYAFDSRGMTLTHMGWVTRMFRFTAVDTSTALKFTSLTPGYFGPALDNVRLYSGPVRPLAVPEPSTLVSCGIAALIGLGLAATRRRPGIQSVA